jgi:hypothetical protein
LKLDLEYIESELLASIRVFKAPVLANLILQNRHEKLLVSYAFSENQILSNRAIWVIAHCNEIDYSRIEPFYVPIIELLKRENLKDGEVRNILRLFQNQSVPTGHETFLLDYCFKLLREPTNTIAIRAFSITIIFNISKSYPELLNELSLLLNDIIANENSPGLLSRAKNTLRKINAVN